MTFLNSAEMEVPPLLKIIIIAFHLLLISDRRFARSKAVFEKTEKSEDKKPVTYASFIIAGPNRHRGPTILAEEQDRFEFPDKKIRVRIKGPNLERRKDEKPLNFQEQNQEEEEIVLKNQDNKVEEEEEGEAAANENEEKTKPEKQVKYSIEFVAKNRFVAAGSAFWFDRDQAVYVADSLGGKLFRFRDKSSPFIVEKNDEDVVPSTLPMDPLIELLESFLQDTQTKKRSEENETFSEDILNLKAGSKSLLNQ